MFDGMFDSFVAQLTPATERLGNTAQAQVERVLARLDRIANAVEYTTEDQYRFVSTPIVAGETDLFTVPQGYRYAVEAVACLPDVAGVIVLRSNGNLRMALTAGVNGLGNGGGMQLPMILTAGERFTVTLTLAASAEFFLQIRTYPDPAHRLHAAYGQSRVPVPDAGDDAPETYRHTTPTIFTGGNGNGQ